MSRTPQIFSMNEHMTIEDHLKFMKIAIECSAMSMHYNFGGPFGAVIVRDGLIIAREGNTVLRDHDATAHAEIQAIRAACRELNTSDLSECILYTSAEPCAMCMGAIYWSNIKTVYYANTCEDTEKAGFKDIACHQEVLKPVEERR
jgi:guanine deaminase